jgi:hypothetical protein
MATNKTKDRFFRSYEINIKCPSGTLFTIKPPFSMNAQITRNTLATANKCNLTIYNLSSTTRAQLYKDRYAFTQYWQIIIKAGYTGGYTHYNFNAQQQFILPTVFQGNIYQCSSQKNGNTWETTFECFDGGYAIQNGFTSQTFTKGTDIATMLRTVISDMPNAITGILSNSYTGTTQRGKTLFGQSSDILTQETQGGWFIDNETINVLKNNECISSEVILLDLSRLRNTPKKRETFVDCDCLFFPEVQIGKICQLYSPEDLGTPPLNGDPYRRILYGQYKIMGITHNINISSADCGEATTTLSLYYGSEGITLG